jgi:Skp family chaperone for outer membrane proteins
MFKRGSTVSAVIGLLLAFAAPAAAQAATEALVNTGRCTTDGVNSFVCRHDG